MASMSGHRSTIAKRIPVTSQPTSPPTAAAAVGAMQLNAFGEPLEQVRYERVAAGPGAIIADVTHAGICGTDLHLQQGRMQVPLPLILGHEAVGIVRELGPGVDRDALGQPLEVGDAISWMSNIPCGDCFYCTTENQPSLCENRKVYGINQTSGRWPHLSGGWSEQMYLQPRSTVVRLPAGATPDQVVALGCAGPTAIHALHSMASPHPGDVVVVQGSGPVGLASAMLAKLARASRIVVVGGPAGRLETARRLGIGDVHIDVFETTPEERLARVLAETDGGRGADFVIEATGTPSAVAEGIDFARRAGTYLVVGQYTDHGETPINPHHITRKQLRVLGSWAFSAADHLDYVRSVPALGELYDLRSLVTHYPLTDVNHALDDMRSGRTLKPVLLPRGTGPATAPGAGS
jgi:threonine dehydrogenase-like Zn-dependent dehydrogenase